jgi:acetyltransferase-like isoleucine patch superfamily enzyme
MRTATALIKAILRPFARRAMRAIAPFLLGELERARQERAQARVRLLLSRLQSCGTNVHINGEIYISEPKTVCIGNNVHIGNNAYLSTAGGLTIGDNTHISRNLTVYTVNHHYEGSVLPYDTSSVLKPVVIGKNVWIGMNVSIVPGVTIGDGAIIGIGTVVTQDVPPVAVVGNPPNRLLKQRDEEHYRRLEQARQYGGANGKPLSTQEVQHFGRHGDDLGDQIFFVVTTGRSGSMTIADVLSQHPQVTCRHEPRTQLIRLSTELAHSLKTSVQVKAELSAIYFSSSVFPQGVYGEADQKLWNLIPIMDELFPASKFIWLIREGREVVASTYARDWFDPEQATQADPTDIAGTGAWHFYRLNGARCGAFSEEDWQQMSVFARNCWYWGYLNEQIECQLSKLPDARWTMIRLHKLDAQRARLFHFLGVAPAPVDVKRLNVSTATTVPWARWSTQQQTDFERWCGPGMDRWYPEWKERSR